jgi:hypothetical protein
MQIPSEENIPAAQRSTISPSSHPKPSGHNVQTRSESDAHSRTVNIPFWHAAEHGKHADDDAGDHDPAPQGDAVTPSTHANPAAHGQHTVGKKPPLSSVQLRIISSPGRHKWQSKSSEEVDGRGDPWGCMVVEFSSTVFVVRGKQRVQGLEV